MLTETGQSRELKEVEVNLLIDGRQRLAVATPRGIELDEDVLATKDHLLKGVGSHHLDRPVVVLWGLLALDELGHLASLAAHRSVKDNGHGRI